MMGEGRMTISGQREFFKKLKDIWTGFYIVHYSCRSPNDDSVGLSPRVTSILILGVIF
jgi:hypothetical protein